MGPLKDIHRSMDTLVAMSTKRPVGLWDDDSRSPSSGIQDPNDGHIEWPKYLYALELPTTSSRNMSNG